MPVSEFTDTETQGQVMGTNLQDEFRVDCYVRSAVPGPLVEMVSSVTERLQRLHDQGIIAEYRISHWPSEHPAVAEADNTEECTRNGIVTEFEQWTERHGYTLEPAFRREEIPLSALGLETGETRERVRVPFVALALYEVDSESNSEGEALRGVIPYTERSNTAEDRTYTVQEWLSTCESKGCEEPTYSSRSGALEGQP
jgi:hypothetical protein